MPTQEQMVPRKKKAAKSEPKLSFDIAAVFSPADIKSDEMKDIDQEYGLYKARKGQAGSRQRQGGPSGGGSNIPPPLI